MISLTDFIPLIRTAIPRFRQYPPNPQQETCILAPERTPLMIVAGPGSGKTTVLVLRALRFVFVDGMMPEHIVITTFTRKAAGEIRSRLIEWGLFILDHLRQDPPSAASPGFTQWLDSIDINRFVTGTLDSICEDTLTTHRDPGDPSPVLVEGFVGNALLAREGMFPLGLHNNPALANYIAPFTRSGQPPHNFGETLAVCRSVVDRLIQDRVDIGAYAIGTPHPQGRQSVVDSLRSYQAYMSQTNRMDFAGLEEVFLDRLAQGRLGRFTSAIRAILVDEYQDTNPLQESIYFELLRQTTASISVVGDDDQSLYRFRGATVELFCNFSHRLSAAVTALPNASTEYLVDNYRSTPEIVAFFNNHISCDPAFATARVQPPKPLILPQIATNGIPVLGMFRPTAQSLAHDLADLLYDIFRGRGATRITANRTTVQIERYPQGGDFGDAVILAYSVDEFASRFGATPPRERLPRLLRHELLLRSVGMFNPRGQALRDIPEVQTLLGMVLECIDPPTPANPDGTQQTSAMLRADARHYLSAWRHTARDFIVTNPPPTNIADFISGWQTRTNQASPRDNWPDEWPILELCYKLITWMPFFQNDPEGQVYLEAITRCIAQAATFSSYRSTIIHNRPPHDVNSVRRAIMDIMVPLAENGVEVDEEIIPHIPRTRLPIMTIHQAKGLEFPLVIVDVASDFSTNNQKQRFKRFPDSPSSTQLLEDDMAPYSNVGPLRTTRTALARSFDDLIRQYYVGYSRAQSVLLLVGIDKCLRYDTTIRHVATGWRSNGDWSWKTPITGRSPAIVNNLPLELI